MTVLSGGVGAARFLRGLAAVIEPSSITAIVNVGDDLELHGLHVSPDLDTVVYTLAGAIDPTRGWGLADESWRVLDELERLGGPTWFRLGDRDLATHLYRTHRLRQGATLREVTAELAVRFDVDVAVVPVTDDALRTKVVVPKLGEIDFQTYFVAHQHSVPVTSVRIDGADSARPARGVIEAITDADLVVIAPSNPVVSIDPVLAVPGVREAVIARRQATVAVSPIVGGRAIKGPAAELMVASGVEASVVGVARWYAEIAATLVIDEADADAAPAVADAGMRTVVTDTIMVDVGRAAALARVTLAAVTG